MFLKDKHLGKLTIVTALLTLLTSNAIASSTSQSINQPSLVTQEFVCPPSSGGSQFVTAETANFYVYICGGDVPNTYIGIAKNQQTGGIILPLQSFTNNEFVAVNGNVSYILTRNELIVKRDNKVIVREAAKWLF